MNKGARTGAAVGAGLLALVVGSYLGVVLTAAPTGAEAATPPPAAPAQSQPSQLLPAQGQFARAVSLAEEQSGGVTIKAEAKNGKGIYEVKVALGNQEIEYVVDTSTQQVTETDREVESPFDD